MSIAGIHSNRGDSYQTLVAMDWALTILFDPDFQWLEIDSVKYPVDDVVVGKTDGTLICCQCKKNQKNFRSWTIPDLADELDKAAKLFESNPKAIVCFYSRSSFGALSKLREHSTTQADDASFYASLGNTNRQTDGALGARLATQSPNLSTFDFLRRTSFEITPEFERMEDLLYERLRRGVSNHKAAYEALWTHFDRHGARMNTGASSTSMQHRFTRDGLQDILRKAGAMLVPTVDLAQVQTSFASTSAIGRSWQREIAGHRIPMPLVDELITAIDAHTRSILLTGMPGSGKTCVMLALQEELEKRAQANKDILPLFIQSREFADLSTSQERQAQGLPGQWVEKAARLAEEVRVVVVIDSLDVLSIAREHSTLTYFLAQIDRLLLVPNITVITACRDFDRRYDRRIAERQWEYELSCQPLGWVSGVVPLLYTLGIDTTPIDAETRELIQNPRELSLFVELALREGSFSVVTSQALGQRYLDTIVRADGELGEEAIKAIEAIADEMLKSRKLAVARQRFTTSQEMLRLLLSHNVLQETNNSELTFGHQTLLDVLVISGALRQGITLNDFIQGLPPVPFVRPSIRSFVEQLSKGNRRDFRKQIRTVLTGNAAFHIRRLVAESIAEQKPHDGDWPLILDLRTNHREVFQVIYFQARRIEWYHFWFTHLVPLLKDQKDAEGMSTHAHRISLWKNEDAVGVLSFWSEILQFDWIDGNQLGMQLSHRFSDFDNENLKLVSPIVEKLLCMPRPEYSSLGPAVARCVSSGTMRDIWLWRYIADDVNDEDVTKFDLNNKLHCRPHEFGKRNDHFLCRRMEQSVQLLDLALGAVEKWSRIKSLKYGYTHIKYSNNFLDVTSYELLHTQHDLYHKDNANYLFDAIEAAILKHASTHNGWWQANRERLCFNPEGALRYFAILACTINPEANVDLIGRMLKDRDMLDSRLSFELGTLIQTAFIYLDAASQDEIMDHILNLSEDELTGVDSDRWILQKRAELIITIPPFLRSIKAQEMLDKYEKNYGTLIREPDIMSRGGMVRAPFSFEVFIRANDDSVLCLLAHYSGYHRDVSDHLVGGELQVGIQLSEASSRQPSRFLNLLSIHFACIGTTFRNDILDGLAHYLSYRYGNLRPNGEWNPLEEPDPSAFAGLILDELERHPCHWYHNRAASWAIDACSHVIKDTQNGDRIVFLAIGFKNYREKTTFTGDDLDLVNNGLNMVSGRIAEALMKLAENLIEHKIAFPELLSPTLRSFAGHEHPSVRAMILRHLPYLQSLNHELGWDLFYRTMQDSTGLWRTAERCLYYAYHNYFKEVAPLLERLRSEGNGKDFETWGRISALAAFAEHVDLFSFISAIEVIDSNEAWQGAAGVWTHPENFKEHREQCLTGISAGLSTNTPHATAIAQRLAHLFDKNSASLCIPIELIQRCFDVLENDNEDKHLSSLYGFDQWLNAIAERDPLHALCAAEIYLSYVKRTKSYVHDYKNSLTQLMTRLFAKAEEREESDQGAMLQRVVSLQDTLLSLGVVSIDDWLKASERP